jgi:hypothetical protein
MSTPAPRHLAWTAVAAAAAMLAWMARPLLAGEIPFTGDLLHFHYPLRDFYARALASGTSFEWMPSLFTGFHAAGDGQLGAYHPGHWLLYRLVPLDAAFVLEVVAPYPFLFAGTWLLLARWTDTGAAAVGALLSTFSGFSLSHGVHVNMVSVVAHLPWLLWALHAAWTAPGAAGRARGAALVAALTGSQLLLGHPQAVWFSLLVEAAYVLLLAATAPGARGGRLAALAGAKALGVLIGAVQLLATLHALGQADRAGADPDFATTFALPAGHLTQLVAPYLPWARIFRWSETAGDEYAAYGGAVALVLAAWWLASAVARRRRGDWQPADGLAAWAAALGALGLWLALGARGGLYLLQTWLPVVGEFRAPARYVLFAHLALAVMAAAALARLGRTPSTDRRAAWAPWLVAGVAVAAAAWWLPAGPGVALPVKAVPVAFFVAAAALVTWAAGGSRAAGVLLVLLAAADLALYGLGGVITWRDYTTRPALVEMFDG